MYALFCLLVINIFFRDDTLPFMHFDVVVELRVISRLIQMRVVLVVIRVQVVLVQVLKLFRHAEVGVDPVRI